MPLVKFHGPHESANGLSAETTLACSGRTMRAFQLVNGVRRADHRRAAEARLDHHYSMRPGWKPNVALKPIYGVSPAVEGPFAPSFTTRVGSAKKGS